MQAHQTHENSQIVCTQIGPIVARIQERAMRLGATVAEFFTLLAAARGAQLLYEELSRLSDAELQQACAGKICRCL